MSGINDLAGFGKVGERIVEAATAMVGAAVGERMRDRAARREVARLLEAVTTVEKHGFELAGPIELDALGIVVQESATRREARRLANSVHVLDGAARALPEFAAGAPEDPRALDEGWLDEFAERAQCAYTDDARQLWGRILASEAVAPGSVSVRSLERLKLLSKAELLAFERLCAFRVQDAALVPHGLAHPPVWANWYMKNVADGPMIDRLVNAGLLEGRSLSQGRNLVVPNGAAFEVRLPEFAVRVAAKETDLLTCPVFDFFDSALEERNRPASADHWQEHVTLHALTDSGAELAKICRRQAPLGAEKALRASFVVRGHLGSHYVVDVHAATAPAIVDAATGAVEYAWTSIDWSDSDCADDAK